jgi:hypothetical protein
VTIPENPHIPLWTADGQPALDRNGRQMVLDCYDIQRMLDRPHCSNTLFGIMRNMRLADLEVKAAKRAKRRRVSITAARVLGRDAARVAYWERMTREAEKLENNLWLARMNPQVPSL